ncbi:C2H2 finger domain protein [Aspergillus luchuensis IFO 4308]|nr:C2H2 finger domain protein [Aspergillus luchuensis IFO 4308]
MPSGRLKNFGEIAGFKWSLFAHRFRYGGGTILNESVEQDPELRKAIQKRDAFSRRLQRRRKTTGRDSDRLAKLKRQVTNARNRLLYALRQRVREESDEEQAVLDIERQLAGTSLPDEEAKEQIQATEHLLPQQTSLIGKLMTWPTSLSVEDEWRRRNEATEAVRLYCDVLEGGPRRGRR